VGTWRCLPRLSVVLRLEALPLLVLELTSASREFTGRSGRRRSSRKRRQLWGHTPPFATRFFDQILGPKLPGLLLKSVCNAVMPSLVVLIGAGLADQTARH
jgi:hypothetical protein